MSANNRISALLILSVIWSSLTFSLVFAASPVTPGYSSQATVAYSVKQSSQHFALLKSPQGIIYKLFLRPWFGVAKTVMLLDLVLVRPGEKPLYGNLLDTTGKPGHQEFDFASHDFVGSSQNSTSEELRVIKLQKLGMKLRVRVVAVHIVPIPGSSFPDGGPVYRFQNLTLAISTQDIPD